MWKKTAIRQLCKYLPLSPEIQKAIALDEAADAGVAQHLADGIIDLPPVEADTPTAGLNAALSETKARRPTNAEIEQAQIEEEDIQRNTEDTTSKILCPAKEQYVDELDCPGCNKRQGCPAWE